MSMQFTEEQIALRDLAREFFEKEVRPVMAEIDARPDPKDCYPAELVRKASEIGLRTLVLPEEYGGVAADATTRALVLATMCEVEAGTAKVLSQCWKVSQLIVEAGTEYQEKKFLTEFAADPDYVTSILMTEPNAGRVLIHLEREQTYEFPGELFQVAPGVRPDGPNPAGPPGHLHFPGSLGPPRHLLWPGPQ
jgi:alkylation response protein AidB-like acyl-CoA dehydrogenase